MSITIQESLQALKKAGEGVDAGLDALLKERARESVAPLYQQLRYFLGFVDADFLPIESSAGKRFRPALCLLVAEAYGVKEKTTEAALAIELFHNFTLIHDDVEDRDEQRRNRPTVWKLWGINHAINSGDVQSLVASGLCARAALVSGAGEKLSRAMFEAFIKVGEGQYLDFELANAPLISDMVSEPAYLAMIRKKSGVLVGIATEAAGIIAGQGADELRRLREYGEALGMAYQIADDYQSVWGTQQETGKDVHSDIREHKRTLPFFAALASLGGKEKERLAELYTLPRQLAEGEIREALFLIEKTDARTRTKEKIDAFIQEARHVALGLLLPKETREVLATLVDALVPRVG